MVRAMRGWIEEELSLLKDLYPEVDSEMLSVKLNRSPTAICSMASRLGVRAVKRKYGFLDSIEEYPFSPELSYLIGAIKGDGYICSYRQKSHPRHSFHYYVSLTSVDFEFVSRVREVLGKIAGRLNKIQVLHQHQSSLKAGNKIYRVMMSDKSLFSLLSHPFEELKPFIEAFPADFLRGFFDAEGSAWVNCRREPVVKYCNNDLELIGYIRTLLEKLGISPALGTYSSVGNLSKTGDPCYFIHIYRKDSIRRFMSLVGSSIPRKRLML